MVDIASRLRGATTELECDLHHIARSVLHQIGKEHCIAVHNQEASTSHGPFIRPPMSSTSIRMQPIRGRGRGRVDRRGRGRDYGRGLGQDGEGGHGTLEPTLPTSIPPILIYHLILPYFPRLTHHPILLYPHQLTHHFPYPHTLTHLYHLQRRQSQLPWQ